MISILPVNCQLELISEIAIEQYAFYPNGHVSATISTKGGAVCAPLYQYKTLTESSIEIFDDKATIATWENIEVTPGAVRANCAGKPITFKILR